MNFVKDQLISRGFEVDVFFIYTSESLFKDHSLTSFCQRNSDLTIHTIEDIVKEFKQNYKNAANVLDKEYLNKVNATYCNDLPFNVLLISSQFFTTQYHFRTYFRDMTEEEKLYWT